jgi:membrane fusion protein, macrolide-specific efflux system
MIAPHSRRPHRARDARGSGAALLSLLALTALVAFVAGCGGSGSSDTPAAGATPTAIQVMATATRGDLTQSVMGQARVMKEGGRQVVVATIDAQNAASVAAGQAATVMFFSGGQSGMPQPGASGVPQGGQSGMPVPQGSGAPMPQGGASGMPVPQGSQGGMPVPQGSQGGMPQGGFPGGSGLGDRGGTAGTVTDVETNADGTAAATISVDELPASATTKSAGFARIEVKVLASDVVLIPTAAVEDSGDSATVQVVANGKIEKRTISVGRQSGSQTEVVSGLNEGENVVYTQSFQGLPGGSGQSGMPFPRQSGQANGGQAGGSYQ